MTRHMHKPSMRSVIIPTKKIITRPHAHVTGGYRNVFIPVELCPGSIINTIVCSSACGKGGHGTLCMVGHVLYVWGKKGLVVVVDAGGDVGPPEEGLDEGGAVVETSAKLKASTVRVVLGGGCECCVVWVGWCAV